MYRPTWAEINLSAFQNNIKAINSYLNKGTKIIAVVKANAYGHMAKELSHTTEKCGISSLGVSSIEEGVALREAGIKSEVIILGSIYPLENLSSAFDYKLVPTISSEHGLSKLEELGAKYRKAMPFHLKVDTGMGRVGVSVDSALKILEKISALNKVKMKGLYTHFARADCDLEYTQAQLSKFHTVVSCAKKLGLKFISHCANSAAIMRLKETHFDMVRPGLGLYGLYPFEGAEKILALEPVLSWKTKIVFLKKVQEDASISYGGTFITKRQTIVATLPVGYADGYNRNLSNKSQVIVRGTRCPVIGRVTMDMIMADVTDIKGVSIGDEVVLIGRQSEAKVSAEEMAAWAGTINYEITCAISYRVPRVII